jgi:HSP20 family molecular chaperone IbpA
MSHHHSHSPCLQTSLFQGTSLLHDMFHSKHSPTSSPDADYYHCRSSSTATRHHTHKDFHQIQSAYKPLVDECQTKQYYRYYIDLPGVNKSKVKIDVSEDEKSLIVTGTRCRRKNLLGEEYIGSERHFGDFKRVLQMPRDGILEHIEADMEHGELIITIPRKQHH